MDVFKAYEFAEKRIEELRELSSQQARYLNVSNESTAAHYEKEYEKTQGKIDKWRMVQMVIEKMVQATFDPNRPQ